MPFSRVQVVVFRLDQHKELLRQNMTGAHGFRRIMRALNDFNPSLVDYQVLKDPAGHRDFLWQLLAKEATRPEPPDAVFFVGYPTLDDSGVFAPPAEGSRKTLFAYFDFAQPGSRRHLTLGVPSGRGRRRGPPIESYETRSRPPGPEMPDAISRIAKAYSGKVFRIYSPGDFAAALQKTTELLRER